MVCMLWWCACCDGVHFVMVCLLWWCAFCDGVNVQYVGRNVWLDSGGDDFVLQNHYTGTSHCYMYVVIVVWDKAGEGWWSVKLQKNGWSLQTISSGVHSVAWIGLVIGFSSTLLQKTLNAWASSHSFAVRTTLATIMQPHTVATMVTSVYATPVIGDVLIVSWSRNETNCSIF